MFGRWAAFARRTDGPIPSWFESWLEAERAAHTLRLWSPILVPGLLQTAEYARALFIAAAEDADRLIGTPAIMHDQLTHLAAVSERPNISVEVVPASTGANAGLGGGFQLASCDGAPDILNMSGVEDMTSEGRSLLRRATVVFDRVRGDALPRTASRCLILEIAEQWKSR